MHTIAGSSMAILDDFLNSSQMHAEVYTMTLADVSDSS